MKKIKMVRIIATLLLGAVLLAACGQNAKPTPIQDFPTANPEKPVATSIPISTSTSPSPVASDACALITKDDVSSVLGKPVDSATSSGLGGVCTYIASNLRFDLTVSNTGGTTYLQQTLANLGENALLVPGLGDEAFFNTNSATLLVRKGDAAYLFNLSDSNYQLADVDKQTLQKSLAEKLIANLP
jgi:hypothetical protein